MKKARNKNQDPKKRRLLSEKEEEKILKKARFPQFGFRLYAVAALFAGIALLAICYGNSFTWVEQKRIIKKGKEGDVMHIYTNLNKKELRFLHQKAERLSKRATRGREYTLLTERMLATVLDSAHAGVGIAALR